MTIMKPPHPSDVFRRRLENLCRRFRVQLFYVFGSRNKEARRIAEYAGKLDPGNPSDLDVAVDSNGPAPLSAREKAEFAIEIEDLFGSNRVDLVLLRDADPFMAVNIIRGERLFCADETAADELELLILRRAGDLERFERQRIRSILSPKEPLEV